MSSNYTQLNLSTGIRSALARARDKVALIYEGRSLTYRALVERIDRAANVAIGHGLVAGDVAAILAPNCLEYFEVVAGFSDVGVTVATLNPRLSTAELRVILEDCRPKLIVVHPSSRDLLPPELAGEYKVLMLGDGWDDALVEARGTFHKPFVAEEAAFSISYTSGTTGKPKGVALSHRSRALMFFMMQAEYGCFGYDDHFLALAPQYHGAGFAFSVATLALGGTTTILGHADAEQMVARMGQGDITGVFMVPTHFHRIFALSDTVLDRYRGKHGLRTIISNAAALPQPTKEQILAYFGEGLLHECYGSTESGIVLNIHPQYHMAKPHSVGFPFAGMEVELRDDDGAIVADGVPGELFARGPTTFNGYLNRPEDTAEAVRDGGWVTVGDIAVRDADGFHYIIDRKKDMVVSGGINVYPREIENVIGKVAGVAEVAVVGLRDLEWGERLHAYIVPAPGAEVSGDAVIAACRAELAGFKVPRGVTLIDELPRNASGKILKKELRERGEAQAA